MLLLNYNKRNAECEILTDFNKTLISTERFCKNKIPSIKFDESLTFRCRLVPCGQTDVRRQVVALRICIPNTANNEVVVYVIYMYFM
jgi:hypothetical protein